MPKPRTTKIRVLDETWRVPRGFGAAYRRVLKDHFELIAAGEPGKLISEVINLLALIGYDATVEQVSCQWDLRRRVEAVIYAATEHARASDNRCSVIHGRAGCQSGRGRVHPLTSAASELICAARLLDRAERRSWMRLDEVP